jgi:hypothetical protein
LLEIKAKIPTVNSRKAKNVCKYISFFKLLDKERIKILDKELRIDSILEFKVCIYIPLFKLLDKEFRTDNILEFNVFLNSSWM